MRTWPGPWSLWWRALAVAALLAPMPAAAQVEGLDGRAQLLQIGPGAFPGMGFQAGFVQQRTFFTIETMFHSGAPTEIVRGKGRLQLGVAVGGSIRGFGAARYFNRTLFPGQNLDLGLRFGPSVKFAVEDETRAEKNKRFNILFEPFLRYTAALGRGWTAFAETGTERPFLRTGFWFRL